MRTLGVDLAADPRKTGACVVDWDALTVELLPRPTTDEALVAVVASVDLAGFDVPLGWPDGFVAAIASHHDGGPWPESAMAAEPPADRVPMRFRVTDLESRDSGSLPLSVSTDLIGVPALRAARIQQLLRDAGLEVDRSGTRGRIAETYPAGTLRRWGFRATGYKGRPNAAVCGELAAEVGRACGPLADAAAVALDGCDDDALDAFLCAVIARAVLQGQTTAPRPDQLEVARREGWIHVPTVGLAEVVQG